MPSNGLQGASHKRFLTPFPKGAQRKTARRGQTSTQGPVASAGGNAWSCLGEPANGDGFLPQRANSRQRRPEVGGADRSRGIGKSRVVRDSFGDWSPLGFPYFSAYLWPGPGSLRGALNDAGRREAPWLRTSGVVPQVARRRRGALSPAIAVAGPARPPPGRNGGVGGVRARPPRRRPRAGVERWQGVAGTGVAGGRASLTWLGGASIIRPSDVPGAPSGRASLRSWGC